MRTSPPTSRLRPIGAFLSSVALTAVAHAGDPDPWVYALNDLGEISVGGTLLEQLPGGYDPSDLDTPQGTSRWMAFDVVDADRWSLRLDGRIESNGFLVGMAPFALVKFTPYWLRLGVAEDVTYALRTDGLFAIDGTAVALLPESNFSFTDLLVVDLSPDEPLVFSLRSDGAVFAGTTLAPLYELEGGDGLFSKFDGFTIDTTWRRLAYDPVSALVYALRADGKIRSLDPDGPPDPPPPPGDEEPPPEAGVAVAELPFKKKPPVGPRLLYVDLGFTDDGSFHALRTDGRLYRADDLEQPLVDLPGDGRSAKSRYVDLATSGASFFALRRDGRVFRDLEDQLLDLPGGRYTQLALGDAAPDLGSSVPHAPRLARWNARALAGGDVALPVLASDVDLDGASLVVDVDLSGAPDAAWDSDARVLTFGSVAAKGVQKVVVTVDDGETKPATTTFRVKPLAPHPGPANRRPVASRITPVPALVGHELVLPVLALDADGDDLVITADESDDVFALGASFDAEASTLTWTPPLAAVGKHTVSFSISDGQKLRKLSLRLLVETSLVP